MIEIRGKERWHLGNARNVVMRLAIRREDALIVETIFGQAEGLDVPFLYYFFL
jgi:hypothetical protein